MGLLSFVCSVESVDLFVVYPFALIKDKFVVKFEESSLNT